MLALDELKNQINLSMDLIRFLWIFWHKEVGRSLTWVQRVCELHVANKSSASPIVQPQPRNLTNQMAFVGTGAPVVTWSREGIERMIV